MGTIDSTEITHCQHPSGSLPESPSPPLVRGPWFSHRGIYPLSHARNPSSRWAQTGRTQSCLPGSRDGSELGTGSNLGTRSKTQALSKSNWKKPFLPPLKASRSAEACDYGKGPPCVDWGWSGEWQTGRRESARNPILVTSSWVSPYLKRVLPLDFQSRVPGFFRSMWVPFSGTCKSRILPCKSIIPPPREKHCRHFGFKFSHMF